MTFSSSWRTILFSSLFFPSIIYGQCTRAQVDNLRRTALIVGVSAYQNLRVLNNPLNDAADLQKCLKNLKFDVRFDTNVNLHQLDTAISGWMSTISRYDIALFYFAGHASEFDGVNYIYPIDGDADSRRQILQSAYSIKTLLDKMEASNHHVNIVLLDACRDNPLSRGPSKKLLKRGFANISSFENPGVLVGFATSPGKQTSDGNGRNGYYTRALIENLSLPNNKLTDILAKVNDATQVLSNYQQLPFISSSLGDHNNYCLLVNDKSAESTIKLTDTFYSDQLKNLNLVSATPSAKLRHLANEALQAGQSKIIREVNIIKDSIKNDFQPISIDQEPLKIGDTSTAGMAFGVVTPLADSVRIVPKFTMKVIGGLFYFSIASVYPTSDVDQTGYSFQLYQYETSHLLDHTITDIQPLSNIDWDRVTELIKSYFYRRIEFLKR